MRGKLVKLRPSNVRKYLMSNFLDNVKRYGFASALTVGASSAMAADFDPTAVNTALGAAETSAHSVGNTVVSIIAGLVAIGIIIAIVRKA